MLKKSALVLIFIGSSSGAQTPSSSGIPHNKIAPPSSPPAATTVVTPHTIKHDASVKVEELIKQPALFTQVFNQMIELGQWDAVEKALPFYEQVNPRDEPLFLYAKGMIARKHNDLRSAIKYFREILLKRPELSRVRADLALTLMMNHQDESATYNFQQLLSESKLTDGERTQIKEALKQLAARSNWTFNAGFSTLYDANINNASKNKYIYLFGLPFKKTADSLPQTAKGWQAAADVSKLFTLHEQSKLRVSLAVVNKNYDLSRFDEQDLRADAGYLWNDGLSQAYVGSYAIGRRIDSQIVEKTLGARISGSRYLNNRWQINGSYDFQRSDYPTLKRLNGDAHLFSLGSTFTFKPTVSIFSILDYSHHSAEDISLARNEWGARIGYSQDMKNGISYTASVHYMQNRYYGEAPIFGGTRRDSEIAPQLTIASRKLTFWGFIPRLTIEYTKHNSNIQLYPFSKWNSYITIDKRF